MKTISLNGNDWFLTGYRPNQWKIQDEIQKVLKIHKEVELGHEVLTVKSKVPGAVQVDLLHANVIPDPCQGLNSRNIEWVNNREWVYVREFNIPDKWKDNRIILCFLGLDYSGFVFIDGKEILSFECMFIPYEIELTKKFGIGKHTLAVVFNRTPEVQSQLEDGEKAKYLKPTFSFGWDWTPRIVPVGIWDDVFLKSTGAARFICIWPRANLLSNNKGILKISTEIDSVERTSGEIIVRVKHNEKIITYSKKKILIKTGKNKISFSIEIENVKPWWPVGLGDQPLYDVQMDLYANGKISDSETKRIGFKHIEMKMNDNFHSRSKPYVLTINGKKVFLQGVNWVPLTSFYGLSAEELYDGFLFQFLAMGCNFLRVWGGGIREKEYFYNKCDELGIIVWQEFPQSSSGLINRLPPAGGKYLKDLKRVAESYIKLRRHHVCHTFWCGGNELAKGKRNIPLDGKHSNLRILKNICKKMDPDKVFFPTSPTGPKFSFEEKNAGKGVHHHVHGPWNYRYNDHYRIFNLDDSHFRTEIGTTATPDLSTLKYASGDEPIWPANNTNNVWIHHGRCWVPWDSVCELFGKFNENKPKELSKFVNASQYIQAESLRYIGESNLRRAFNCSSTVFWMGNEPFPNMSNTSIVDALGHAKASYGWIQKCFSGQHISFKYDKLGFDIGEEFSGEVFIHNNNANVSSCIVEAKVFTATGKHLYSKKYTTTLPENCSKFCGRLTWVVENIPYGIFIVRLILSINKKVFKNTYIFTTKKNPPLEQLRLLPNTELRIEKKKNLVYITNIGKLAAVLVLLYNNDHGWFLITYGNGEILFPGEKTQVKYRVMKRVDYSKLLEVSGKLDLRVRAFNVEPIELNLTG